MVLFWLPNSPLGGRPRRRASCSLRPFFPDYSRPQRGLLHGDVNGCETITCSQKFTTGLVSSSLLACSCVDVNGKDPGFIAINTPQRRPRAKMLHFSRSTTSNCVQIGACVLRRDVKNDCVALTDEMCIVPLDSRPSLIIIWLCRRKFPLVVLLPIINLALAFIGGK